MLARNKRNKKEASDPDKGSETRSKFLKHKRMRRSNADQTVEGLYNILSNMSIKKGENNDKPHRIPIHR